MKKLYQAKEPYKKGKLKVSALHRIYYEESGNPKGKPFVYLHGGPGSYSQVKHRRSFDPKKYRIILFDQRGCGKSTPMGEIRENTTWDLVEDMEKLRKHLNLEYWHVYGSSWGSTLALAYAEKYPDRVSALMLKGVFTFTKWEIAWLHGGEARAFYPEAYEVYMKDKSKKESGDMMSLHYERIFSKNKKIREQAFREFDYWDGVRLDLVPSVKFNPGRVSKKDLAGAQIYFHYCKNQAFLREGQLISNARKLKNIPGVILHGRYDMACPPISAWRLHKAWPEADFHLMEVCGHKSNEPEMHDMIVRYTDKFNKI